MRYGKHRRPVLRGLLVLVALLCLVQAAAADWVVAKSSGQVWIASANAQPVALSAEAKLLPGDLLQTGPNGRILLTRGDERILVAPNSVISIPKDTQQSGFTTILQQAGSIAVEAEKKNHQHFEVQTPYLAAVVKGTQFTVSVGEGGADVRVTSGQVQTINLKSGRSGLVLPGQSAHVSAQSEGVFLSGRGNILPVEQGTPRPSALQPINVPKAGLKTPPKVDGMRVRSVQLPGHAHVGGVRITHPIGVVKLDVAKATLGLARGDALSSPKGPVSARNDGGATIWGGGTIQAVDGGAPATLSVGASVGSANANSNAGGNGNGLALGVGNGNGNGNAYGLANGNNGNGNAYGLANGNNGKHLGKNK